jgi:hypothetical protein
MGEGGLRRECLAKEQGVFMGYIDTVSARY